MNLNGILFGLCPVCQQQSMYCDPNLYRISNTSRMHERYNFCSTKYKMEPSFFYGAMYVNFHVPLLFV